MCSHEMMAYCGICVTVQLNIIDRTTMPNSIALPGNLSFASGYAAHDATMT